MAVAVLAGRTARYDVVVDGVSTVENYRSSFNRVISKEGVDGLIKKLEKGSLAKSPGAKAAEAH
jgi:ABC-type transporter MlaC component